MIVKVQRPMHTNDPDRSWLIYQKGYKGLVTLKEDKVPEDIRERFEAEDIYKAYYEAIRKDEGYILGEPTQDQEW